MHTACTIYNFDIYLRQLEKEEMLMLLAIAVAPRKV